MLTRDPTGPQPPTLAIGREPGGQGEKGQWESQTVDVGKAGGGTSRLAGRSRASETRAQSGFSWEVLGAFASGLEVFRVPRWADRRFCLCSPPRDPGGQATHQNEAGGQRYFSRHHRGKPQGCKSLPSVTVIINTHSAA